MKLSKTLVTSGLGLALATTSALAVTFSELDSDGSGSVDSTEFSTAFPDAPEGSFATYDADGDGAITSEEAGGGSGDGSITFSEIDVNDNGVLEEEEMEHVFGDRAQIALAKFDKDGDGVVTLDEVRSSDDPVGERGHRADNPGKDRSANAGSNRGGNGNSGNRGGSDDAGGNGNSGGNGGGKGR